MAQGQHQLVVAFLVRESRHAERLRVEQFGEGTGHPGWRLPQVLAGNVDTSAARNSPAARSAAPRSTPGSPAAPAGPGPCPSPARRTLPHPTPWSVPVSCVSGPPVLACGGPTPMTNSSVRQGSSTGYVPPADRTRASVLPDIMASLWQGADPGRSGPLPWDAVGVISECGASGRRMGKGRFDRAIPSGRPARTWRPGRHGVQRGACHGVRRGP